MITENLKLVHQMRTAQKDYFKARKDGTGKKILDEMLVKAKSLESMVDKMIIKEISNHVNSAKEYKQTDIDFLATS